MSASARLVPASDTLALRTRFRDEMHGQITKDSIHSRPGWLNAYLLELDGVTVGFGGIAIAGPWKDKPTNIEFYVVPELRQRMFTLFETFLAASDAQFFEVQSNVPCLPIMLHTY